MLQFEAWKKTLVILVAALGIIYAAPNLLPVEREGGGILPGQKINLGLDLQGGSHLLLRVDMDAVVQERLESVAETIRQEFRGRKIRFSGLDVRNAQVRVRLRDTGDEAEARTVFEEFSRFVDIGGWPTYSPPFKSRWLILTRSFIPINQSFSCSAT